jgi:nucleoside-diphosphate-sugar epimerase
MRLFITGGTGVIGRAFLPAADAAGHILVAPTRTELDLFDPAAVAEAVAGCDAVLHLATRIPPPAKAANPEAWAENDRLRAEASRILVDTALAAGASLYLQPTVAFVYPPDVRANEDTPLGPIAPILRSALAAEQQALRFAAASRTGVVLRLGLLDGPGTANTRPDPRFGATLHVHDAAHALLAALSTPSAIYNICRDHERISNTRFKTASGWHPHH